MYQFHVFVWYHKHTRDQDSNRDDVIAGKGSLSDDNGTTGDRDEWWMTSEAMLT